MIHISEPNNLQAKCVLLHVKDLLENSNKTGAVIVHPYVNCREQGFNITLDALPEYLRQDKRLSVSFSEARNSDSIVVYFGKASNFAFNTYIPDDKAYATAIWYKYGEYAKAAHAIVDYLIETE